MVFMVFTMVLAMFSKIIGFTMVFHRFLRMRAPALQLLSFSMESLKEVKHSEPGELQSFNWSVS